MKNGIIFSGILCLLLIGSVSAEMISIAGVIVNDQTYASMAPCYTDNLIKSYGPVPVYDKDHNVVSKGIMAGINGISERDALYKKLHNLYEATKVSFDKQYSYPNGPVLAYGYDALGSVTVGLYENQTVDQETIDTMYSFIATEAKNQGIEDVPVIFYKEQIARLGLGRGDVWRPIIGGVQDASYIGRITTGFAATRGGQSGFVTTGHAGGVGTTIYQPDSSNSVGTITVSSGGVSSDSAWVQYNNVAGQIFESPSSQPSIYGTANPYVGLGVTMSGISSGITTGTVQRETSLYNRFFRTTLYNQWYADFASAEGDSGGPVYFKDANQNIQLVGLYWGIGSYSVFSPISNVLSDLS